MAQCHGSAAPSLEPGLRVRGVGLWEHRSHLNDKTGKVVEYDASLRRWSVRLDTGAKKSFKEKNLRTILHEEDDGEEDTMPEFFFNEPSPMRWQAKIEERLAEFEMQLGKLSLGMNEQKVLVDGFEI